MECAKGVGNFFYSFQIMEASVDTVVIATAAVAAIALAPLDHLAFLAIDTLLLHSAPFSSIAHSPPPSLFLISYYFK